MGFNKRYINIKLVKECYIKDGIVGILNLYNVDVIISDLSVDPNIEKCVREKNYFTLEKLLNSIIS